MMSEVFKKFFIITTSILVLLFCVLPITFAKSLTFTISTTSLDSGQEAIITASPSGFIENETLYVKVAFFKEGSSNYFGKTKVDGSWVKNSAKTVNQKKIVLGTWDNTLIIQSDPDDTGFVDSGNYKVKVGYYQLDDAGEPKSVSWSTTVLDIYLKRPDPTQTPTLIPTKTPTATPTNTIQPTSTTVPTRTPTVKAVPSLEGQIINKPESVEKPEGQVLGEEKGGVENIQDLQETRQIPHHLIISLSMVGVGSAILAMITLIPKLKKRKEERI